MADDDKTELAALVIAIVALVIATGQLLQQVFATADGYRRCEASVIGPWAEKTRLVWRWRQFRCTTPDIVLYNINDHRAARNQPGSSLMIEDITRSPLVNMLCLGQDLGTVDHNESADLVSWTSLLRQLLRYQVENSSQHQTRSLLPTTSSTVLADHTTQIGIVSRERTWDLMPPEVIRPLAMSNLGTIISIAHRLRMRWITYQITEGAFHAQGAGHTFTSSTVRGLGIIFRYGFTNTPAGDHRRPELDTPLKVLRMQRVVPSEVADKLACGIPPGIPELRVPEMPMIGQDDLESDNLLYSCLKKLGLAGHVVEDIAKAQRVFEFRKGSFLPMFYPMNDMVALVCPFLPVHSCPATKVCCPFPNRGREGRNHPWEWRQTLLSRLEQHPTRHNMEEVYTRMCNLAQTYEHDFCGRWHKALRTRDCDFDEPIKVEYLLHLRTIHDWTTDYFKNGTFPLKFYVDLIAEHIPMALKAARLAKERKLPERAKRAAYSSRPCGPESVRSEQHRETGHMYVDLVPELVKWMHGRGHKFPDHQIEQAWWTLMLRVMVWFMGVHFVNSSGYAIPSYLYYSQTPAFVM